MIKTSGKVFDDVKRLLEARGIDARTLQIATFGRTTYHDIILHDRVVGSYEHKSKTLQMQP